MKLILDTTLIDIILKQWREGTFEYSEVYNHFVFQELLVHAEDFQKRKIGAEQYLNELLHISGVDMQQYQKEIERNLDIIKSIDLSSVTNEIRYFLPVNVCDQMGDIYIYPIIGIAGLAKKDFVVIDPLPCSCYHSDGMDSEQYINEYILPLIRHEIHHVGYMYIRPNVMISQLHNLCDLTVDMIREIQKEGGAILCEKQDQTRKLSEPELRQGVDGFKRIDGIVSKWLERGNCEINSEEWNEYYSLWGPEKIAYWLGEFICLLLTQEGYAQSVADCMLIEPLELLKYVKKIINTRITGKRRKEHTIQ